MKCSFVICRCSYRVQCGPAWQETCDDCARTSLTSWAAPGFRAAVSVAIAVAAVGVSAVIAASVAGPAAFVVHWRAGSPAAGVPRPASAGACLVPLADSPLACPAAADTFCPASACPYLERSECRPEDREGARQPRVERSCSAYAPDSLRDCPEYKALLPPWLVLRRDR